MESGANVQLLERQRDRTRRFIGLQASILDMLKSGARTYDWVNTRLQQIVNEPDPQKNARLAWDKEFPGRGEEVMDLIGPFYDPALVLTLKPPAATNADVKAKAINEGANFSNIFWHGDVIYDPYDGRITCVSAVNEDGNPAGYYHMKELMRQCLRGPRWGPELFSLPNMTDAMVGVLFGIRSREEAVATQDEAVKQLWGALFSFLTTAAWSVCADLPESDREKRQKMLRFFLHELWLRGNFPLRSVTEDRYSAPLIVLVERAGGCR